MRKGKKGGKGYGYLPGIITSTIPFEQVHVDIYGPIDTWQFNHQDENDKVYVLSMIDAYSRFLRFKILTQIDSFTVTKNFIEE